MEEQWNVIYVDRISGRELTSGTLDSRKPLCSMPATSTATMTRFCA
jgi:hypothetical protein